MYKIKLPPYPQIFPLGWLLKSDNDQDNASAVDEALNKRSDIVPLPTTLIKLSPYSKTFYTEWLLEPDSYQYNMLSADQTLYGDLDIERLRTALNRYVTEHVLLNSHIKVNKGEPYWVRNSTVSGLDYDATLISEPELLAYVQQPFNLFTGPLYRFRLVRLSEGVHRLIIVLHHLVMDGMSINTGVFDAISNYYNRADYTTEHSVPTQINLLTQLEHKLTVELEKNKTQYRTFWRQQLSDIENIDLSFLHAPSTDSTLGLMEECSTIAEVRFNFEPAIFDKLTPVAAQYQISPYVYSQCIFAILLHKYTGQQHFAINFPISIKDGADFIYGSQVNLNLIAYHFTPDTKPSDILNYARDFYLVNIKNDIKHGHYPISDILQAAGNNKHLLQVSFAQAYFRDKPFQFFDIEKTEATRTLSVDGVTKEKLIFEQDATREELNYRVKYARNSVNKDLLDAFINSYKKLFIDVLEDLSGSNKHKLIADYSLLTSAQYKQLVYGFNQTVKYPRAPKTIHQLFEEQVAKVPDNIAIVYEDRTITYRELNERANQLARYINRTYSIQPDDLIALYLDKNEYTIIAILAVLKCGAAYVPIDTGYPLDRTRYIIEDTRAKAVIIRERFKAKLNAITDKSSLISLDSDLMNSLVNEEEKNNLNTRLSSSSLAYVIYTSGTTGQPKGVLQEHSNVVSLFQATKDLFQFNANDVWLLFHSYVFDFTVWEIWGALIHGGKLVIPHEGQRRDFEELHRLCRDTGVTVLNQTTSALYRFLEIALKNSGSYLANLRYILFGGEKVNFTELNPWFTSRYKNRPQLVHVYGVTELTVLSSSRIVNADDLGNRSYIGKMFADQTSYVVDSELSILPIGVIGELYVGGEGLARGYLNQTELTRERFIRNPFQTDEERLMDKNSRLYKTGDLVRRLPDGSLEYIGRNDTQLKIRGYRIEPGEIEALLCLHPNIRQAVVLAADVKNDSDTEPNFLNHKAKSDQKLSEDCKRKKDVYTVASALPKRSNLLPIQAWFFAQNFKNLHHFNQSFLIRTPQLDINVLRASLTKLFNYHDCFSLRYSSRNGVIQPFYALPEMLSVALQELDIRSIPYNEGTMEFNEKLNEILTDWQSGFDITNGPLHSVGYIHGYKDGSTRVYFALHHLIVDVVSWHIIAHNLQKIYTTLTCSDSVTVSKQLVHSPLVHNAYTSYAQWIDVLQSYAPKNLNEKAYWSDVLAGHEEFNAQLTKLAASHDDSAASGNLSDKTILFTINRKLTDALLAKSKLPPHYKVNEILLSVLAITVKELISESGNKADSVYITIEGHGREDIDHQVDISRTIGWFTTMFPCRLDIHDANPFEVLKLTKQTIKAVPANGLGYGALFGYAQSLPSISFNYLGQLSSQGENTFWSITGEPSGRTVDSKNKNSNVIDIICWIVNGQLEFTLASHLNSNRANRFIEIFKARLVTILNLISSSDGNDFVGHNAIRKFPYLVHSKKKISHAFSSARDILQSDKIIKSSKRLVAYYVSNTELDPVDIRAYLSKQLPPYSVPQEFIWLNAMPLKVSGKIDTEALLKLRVQASREQTLPRNEKENLICEIFTKVLNKKQVGIYDDFFAIGGDSLSAITLVMHLQSHFQVNVQAIFTYKTPFQLAKHLTYSSNTIKNKLLEIMSEYRNQTKIGNFHQQTIKKNLENYFSSAESSLPDISSKKIKNVLLTGATGFLGSNLLNQLLTYTDYTIYLLIKADSDQSAIRRINDKYQSYFLEPLYDNRYKNRVFVFCADLEKADFGLSRGAYAELVHNIDSVIHSAALVKQFGDADLFYNANVQATLNLLEFTKLTKLKDFHYISTASVLKNNSEAFKRWGNYCTEENLPENCLLSNSNIYIKSKLEGERQVVRYRTAGVNANIYRVGNLAFMIKNCSVQENIYTIGFTYWLRYLLQSKLAFTDTRIDISPTDLTANAIVKLFDKKCSTNNLYHVFNSRPFDLVKFMQQGAEPGVKVLTVPEFIQYVIYDLENTTNIDSIVRFLLAHGWMGIDGIYQFSQQIYLQNRTQSVLKQLGFEWPSITNDQFKKYQRHLF